MAQKFIPRNFAIHPVVSGEQSTKIHKIPVISDITNDYKLHLKIIKKKTTLGVISWQQSTYSVLYHLGFCN